ncbi:hypothetical protein Nepgr_015978 [Nepenthes gracilis]|uniref:Uncharacterized protein n=1 Tax=Nepenthes gracilis TaxID=150966 RepID=A0AAD3SN04_NEPGR|nr:hypothetical protein Nepgr_015978 [Nepenthes gracilis]
MGRLLPSRSCRETQTAKLVKEYSQFNYRRRFSPPSNQAPSAESLAAEPRKMALTNLILTVAGVTAAILLLRSDVKQSATIFRRNVRQIRQWLEEETVTSSKAAEKAKPKELESQNHGKDIPKDDKH